MTERYRMGTGIENKPHKMGVVRPDTVTVKVNQALWPLMFCFADSQLGVASPVR